ncbi:MAG: SPASM domain-containing protein, partial [Candidatus Cloacimonas sp.]|nr:SPASM domain-containing protein [Candidatus Cloacimonadota bacterium]
VPMVRQICQRCPDIQIVVNLSIDGIGEQHDQIRNVPGNYEKVMATYRGLMRLKAPNLAVGIHTVISRFNVHSFPSIADGLLALNPDSYITEIAEERKELNNIGHDITPTALEYRSAIDFLLHRIRNRKFYGMNRITQALRIEYYNLVKKILRDQKQVIPCYAGVASCQIATNGDVWSCCVRAESVGNLRDNDYDFRKVWFSKEAKKLRRSIKRKECYCPLANASYTNIMLNIPSLIRIFIRSFIKW